MIYNVDDLYVDCFGNVYVCVVSGTVEDNIPFNKNNIVDDKVVYGTSRFILKDTSDCRGTNYRQVYRQGVEGSQQSPAIIDITINPITDFNLPPVEVLKIGDELENQSVVVNTFSSSESSSYNYNTEYVKFNGAMTLNTVKNLSMSQPAQISDMFYSESEVIDIGDYVLISSISVR